MSRWAVLLFLGSDASLALLEPYISLSHLVQPLYGSHIPFPGSFPPPSPKEAMFELLQSDAMQVPPTPEQPA